ncbi:Sorting nexin mvp1 [Umbelopsis nana]
MLDEDNLSNAFYFDSAPPKTLLTPSSAAPITASMYNSHFEDDDDPWGSVIAVDPMADMARSINHQVVMNRSNPDPSLLDVDEIMANAVTASSALSGVKLPPIYETAFAHAGPSDGKVSLQALNRVLSLGGSSPYMIEKITNLVVPGDASYVTKSEFNAALALLALSQKNVDVSVHSLSRHRNDLPLPVLIGVEDLEIKQQPFTSRTSPTSPHAADDDPWKTLVSVETHSNGVYSKPHTPEVTKPAAEPKVTNVRLEIKETVTKAITVVSKQPEPATPAVQTSPVKERPPSPPHETPVESPRSVSSPSYQQHSPSPAGTPSTHHSAIAQRTVTPERPRVRGSTDNYQWFLDMDLVKVNVAPEREGFLFKHTNYVVESQQRSSVVLRRYSDFWWLLETLMKRYPFRILPNLPPKKLGGMDGVFLDKRRKGLARFVNFLVCHPILGQDQVVEKFLSEPSELLAWRRQHPPSIDEEFVRLDPDVKEMQADIPADLEERLAKVASNIAASIEHYKNMCFAVERMIKRTEAQASDYSRYSLALRSLVDVSRACHQDDCSQCYQVAQGCEAVSTHIMKASTILEDKSAAATNGILENLKRHRDLLVSFKELLERKEKLAVNQIDALNKRINFNQTKVNQHRGVPGLENEVERLDQALKADRTELEYQTRRQIYIQHCMFKELTYLHKQQGFVSVMYQSFVNDQIKFSQLSFNNWKSLEDPVYQMPAEMQ